jgi:hypothetical protein
MLLFLQIYLQYKDDAPTTGADNGIDPSGQKPSLKGEILARMLPSRSSGLSTQTTAPLSNFAPAYFDVTQL